MKSIILQLREKLVKTLEKSEADGLLFSGGLDTSILAVVLPKIKMINVSLGGKEGDDLRYAKFLEDYLKLEVHYLKIGVEEALSTIPQVIKILKSFDPAIPNDIVIYSGLKFANELGLKTIMTGDGADELLVGYEYMWEVPNLNKYLHTIVNRMSFSSNKIGKFFGIDVNQPYMDREFIEFVINEVPLELKLSVVHGKTWGKWILRKAFEDMLPGEIIWQPKRAIEYGAGTTRLREIISEKISDDEFIEKQRAYPVKFMSKEHMYYYEIYKDVIGELPSPKEGEAKCTGCGSGLSTTLSDWVHCKVCGWSKSIK